jgi:hypothetical protein
MEVETVAQFSKTEAKSLQIRSGFQQIRSGFQECAELLLQAIPAANVTGRAP